MEKPVGETRVSHEYQSETEITERPSIGINRLARLPNQDRLTDATAPTQANRITICQQRVLTSVAGSGTLLPDIGAPQLVTHDKIRRHEPVVHALRTASRKSLHQLFNALPPPQLHSLQGEYDAELLSQGNPFYDFLTSSVFRLHGRWLGKAFCPVGCSTGVGYNVFGSHESPVHRFPMQTSISKSLLDNRLSLTIVYNVKNEGLITRLFGEVRQVTPNVLLGIGIAAPGTVRRKIGRRKVPFLLVGPFREYQDSSPA